MHAVTTQGRWAWGVSGLVAAAVLAIPGARLIAAEQAPWDTAQPTAVTVRTVAVTQPVTSLLVQSYGGRVRVAAGQVSHVQVAERIAYDPKAGAPAVAESVSGGRLSLGDPACARADCAVDFSVTVPPAVSVTVDTQGGPAEVTQVTGPLTVRTGGGPLITNEVAGPVRADTSGGVLTARGVTASTASLSTGGGPAQVTFAAAPDTVNLSTDGGPATLRLPGGPYALTADSDGGPELIRIATDPAARASVRVTSGGGPILVSAAAP